MKKNYNLTFLNYQREYKTYRPVAGCYSPDTSNHFNNKDVNKVVGMSRLACSEGYKKFISAEQSLDPEEQYAKLEELLPAVSSTTSYWVSVVGSYGAVQGKKLQKCLPEIGVRCHAENHCTASFFQPGICST